MKYFDPEDFLSWFDFINIECVDDELCDVLAKLNINDPIDQDEIIKIAFVPEFEKLNSISKEGLKEILVNIDHYSAPKVRDVMSTSSSPFE